MTHICLKGLNKFQLYFQSVENRNIVFTISTKNAFIKKSFNERSKVLIQQQTVAKKHWSKNGKEKYFLFNSPKPFEMVEIWFSHKTFFFRSRLYTFLISYFLKFELLFYPKFRPFVKCKFCNFAMYLADVANGRDRDPRKDLLLRLI